MTWRHAIVHMQAWEGIQLHSCSMASDSGLVKNESILVDGGA